jgi:hypothetical protein
MGDGVREGSGKASYSMMEARHGVMMLGEEFGIHLPRGITTFISSLGPVGAAMEAAFPFLAVILGATLLIEGLRKMGEAEEKVAEAGRKMTDDLLEGINKADQGIVKSAIEIRKLAGSPAWDLLNEKLRLEDAARGFENVSKLEKAVKELLEHAPTTSNWNPLNWFDGSGDVVAKAKALQEKLHGKPETEQAGVLQDTLAMQSRILEQMKGQSTTSEVALHNQQKYVDYLRLASTELERQVLDAANANQAQQQKDRADRIEKEEEEARKLAETRQKGLDHRQKIEADFAKKQKEAKDKQIVDNEAALEMERKADESFAAYQIQQAAEVSREQAAMGREQAAHSIAMGTLQVQAEREAAQHKAAMRHMTDAQIMADHLKAANDEYRIRMQAYALELGALDKYGRDYEVKLRQIQNKQLELTREHENKVTQIKTSAEEARNARILSADGQTQDMLARGLTQSLMRHQNFGAMLLGIGGQIAEGMIQNSIKSILANDMTKPSDAAAAARKGWNSGMKYPWPTDMVMAPVLAALGFASVMAFEEGGVVPGVGNFDTVPAKLTPGEGVIPKPIMERLSNSPGEGGKTTHVKVNFAPHINAIDSNGVSKMLEKHADKFAAHVEAQLRRRNV